MTTAFDNFYDAPSPANAIELAIAKHVPDCVAVRATEKTS